MKRSREQAALLLRKAQADMRVLEIDSAVVADDIFGFHAQQAAEKLLKALLSARAATFRHTHDITRLIAEIGGTGAALGSEFEPLKRLTVYAVAFRYADLPPQIELDRAAIRELLNRLCELVESSLSNQSGSPRP